VRWQPIAAGVFSLIVLQVLVANPNAYGAVGGLATGVGNAVRWFLDPNTPAIPDRSKAKTSSAVTTTPSSTTAPATNYLPPYTGPASVQPGTV
jgi:hypothetical protein